MFLRLKVGLKGHSFETVVQIQVAVMHDLQCISDQDSLCCFEQWQQCELMLKNPTLKNECIWIYCNFFFQI